MANQKAVAPAQSAIVPELINGQTIDAAQASIVDIGFGTQRAERAIASGTSERDVLDNNLLHWIVQVDEHGRLLRDEQTKKYVPIPYAQFMQVRDWYVGAAFDAGAETTDAADKVWERAINRLISNDFVRPKAASKDAVRMSEKAAKLKAELDAKSTAELEARKTELLEKGDTKSLREAGAISKALDERMKPEVDKAKAEAAALADKITKRVRELKSSATPDAIELLVKIAQLAG